MNLTNIASNPLYLWQIHKHCISATTEAGSFQIHIFIFNSSPNCKHQISPIGYIQSQSIIAFKLFKLIMKTYKTNILILNECLLLENNKTRQLRVLVLSND